MGFAQKRASGDTHVSTFTTEGIPLDHDRAGVVPSATNVRDRGPARRIDCHSTQSQLIAAPSPTRTPKSQSSEDVTLLKRRTGCSDVAPPKKSLKLGPVHSSLIDDDDDELVDYFGASDPGLVALAPDDGLPLSSHWNVREYNVRTLPSFYPLEKSAVFVPHASANTIATRIVAVLQDRSIAASYDTQNAKVDCVSETRVEFRIRLYRGRGEEYKHGIIVEVQRRVGFELSYIQDVYAILDAAGSRYLKEPI